MSFTPPVASNQRLDAVNVLRGAICLGVMGLHFAYLFRDAGGWVNWALWARPGVECFFVLSGYFLSATYMLGKSDETFSVPGLLGRRFVRLLVPYWVAVTVVYLAPLWRVISPSVEALEQTPEIRTFYVQLADVLANLTGTADLFNRPLALFTFWSLASLLQLHVLFAGLFWLVRLVFLKRDDGRHHALTLTVMHVVVLVGTLVSAVIAFGRPGGPNPVHNAGWNLPEWFVYVGVGWAAFWASEGLGRRWLLAAAVAMLVFGLVVSASPRPVFAAGTAVILVWCARQPAALGGRAWGPLRAVGRWSYSVYLVHGIVGYRAMTALAWAGVPQSGGWVVLHFVVGAAASVAVAFGFFRLVETPVAKWASRIRYRAAPPRP